MQIGLRSVKMPAVVRFTSPSAISAVTLEEFVGLSPDKLLMQNRGQ